MHVAQHTECFNKGVPNAERVEEARYIQPHSPCLSLRTQKTEDVPIQMSTKCCQGGGSSSSSTSSSISSYSSSGGASQYAKEQLPKYQVPHPSHVECPGVKSFTLISPQGVMPAGGFHSRNMRISVTKCTLLNVSHQCCFHTVAFIS